MEVRVEKKEGRKEKMKEGDSRIWAENGKGKEEKEINGKIKGKEREGKARVGRMKKE